MTERALSDRDTARQDLHHFLRRYEKEYPADVLLIEDEVSPDEGVTGIVSEMTSRGDEKLVICRNVTGLSVEIVTNVFGSRRRIARMLSVEPDDLHEGYQRAAARSRKPVIVESGPVLDNIVAGEDVDLSSLPMLRHFASDAAPYITSGIIVAESPDRTSGNLSYHRAMIHSRNELATSLHSRGHLWRLLLRAAQAGRSLEVAMVIGAHPLFMLAASARVGEGVDERDIAGGLFDEALSVVLTPRYGLGVPASADFVLEGVILPGAHVEEGPFGEFTGYSSHRSTNNLFRVETVCSRRDALLLDVVAGNSADHLNLGRLPRESEMAERLRERFPEVVAIQYPNSGTHFHCYVSLCPGRPGQARQVMLALLGWDPYLKTVVAVDDDIDVTDDAQVLWSIATHLQPRRDVFVVDGLPGSALDPSAAGEGTTSRMALDATRSPGFEGSRIEISPAALGRARDILARLDDPSPISRT